MTSETYYPEHRHMMPLTRVRRWRSLPDSVQGQVEVNSGSRVDMREVVVRGEAPAPYTLVNASTQLKLKNAEQLIDLLEVRVGDSVHEGQLLARKGRSRLESPITGRVVRIEGGLILLQNIPSIVEVEAGLNGHVVEVARGRGVVVETYGAVLQGVWGNGRRTVGMLRAEPMEGLEHIYGDTFDMEFRGAIVFTRRPLNALSLRVIDDQGLVGVVAPSIEPELIDAVKDAKCAILLIEGFGSTRLSGAVTQFLEEHKGRQALLDGTVSNALDLHRPELIITLPVDQNARPSLPDTDVMIQVGSTVRVVRGDSMTSIGQVTSLPKTPVLLDNGMRVQCAEIELVTGERLAIPLENIEVFGR